MTVLNRVRLTAGVIAALMLLPAEAGDWMFGADLSFANEMDDCGAVFKDNGVRKDVYQLFKDHGANTARVRLWTDGNTSRYSTPEDVVRSLKRAKATGLRTLLAFHYSDIWADGGNQIIPAAWAGIRDPRKLAEVLYRYTYDTLIALDRQGAMPDIVQPGNEINRDMLSPAPWKGGAIDWRRNALLLNSAIRAIRDAGRKTGTHPRVMIQIAQPENTLPWFSNAAAAGVTDFDMIGVSYYTQWSYQSLRGLGRTISILRHTYRNADVVVVETAYPRTTGTSAAAATMVMENVVPGLPATPEGQKRFLIELGQAVIANGGKGVLTWAPEWLPQLCRPDARYETNWSTMTLFDSNGEALPAIDHMRLANYRLPVNVTFRFHDTSPAARATYWLWGDFFGDTAPMSFPLSREGSDLVFRTSLMPGMPVQFQVFEDRTLKTSMIRTAPERNGAVNAVVGEDRKSVV